MKREAGFWQQTFDEDSVFKDLLRQRVMGSRLFEAKI
jgi:hypothetical protein